MHNCKGAGLSRSESGTFYLYTVIILLSSCFFIPTAVLFYKPAVRSSLPCAHNSSGSVGDRIQIIPPSIDELPSSADLLPVILACAAFPHYLLSVIYSFTRRFSVHFICTTMSITCRSLREAFGFLLPEHFCNVSPCSLFSSPLRLVSSRPFLRPLPFT